MSNCESFVKAAERIGVTSSSVASAASELERGDYFVRERDEFVSAFDDEMVEMVEWVLLSGGGFVKDGPGDRLSRFDRFREPTILDSWRQMIDCDDEQMKFGK